MTYYCGKTPCGMTTGGSCGDPNCPNVNRAGWPPMPPAPIYPAPVGCICPPTSEQTCGNPVCPRRHPFGHQSGLQSR